MLKNRIFKLFILLLVSAGLYYLVTETEIPSEEETTKQEESYEGKNNSKKKEEGKQKKASAGKKTDMKKAKAGQKKVSASKKSAIKKASEKQKKAYANKKASIKKVKAKQKKAPASKPQKKSDKKQAAKSTEKKLSNKETMHLLSDSLVSSSSGYFEAKGADSVSVFAEKRKNLIGMKTGSWYNLWGNNVGNCSYNMSRLKKHGTKLNMKAGMEDGGTGTATIEFYMDKSNDGSPDYSYELDASLAPVDISVDIKNVKSMEIQITNHSGDPNTIALYGMSLS